MHRGILCGLLASALLPLACPAEESASKIGIDFALTAAGQPWTCSAPPVPLGRGQAPSRLRDARFYVHDIRLIRHDGASVALRLAQNEWQYLDVALIDLEDGQGGCVGNRGQHARVTGEVPAGDYRGLQFTVGVPVSSTTADGRVVPLNHSNTEQIAAPLDIQAMAWNWQAGRKFMKVELLPEGGVARAEDTVKVWTVHLGSTGCVGNPANGEIVACSSPNRIVVRFDDFDPARQRVLFDLSALFEGSDVGRDQGGAAGCMSSPQDPECPAIFRQLGLPLAVDGAPVAAPTPATTRVFRVGS